MKPFKTTLASRSDFRDFVVPMTGRSRSRDARDKTDGPFGTFCGKRRRFQHRRRVWRVRVWSVRNSGRGEDEVFRGQGDVGTTTRTHRQSHRSDPREGSTVVK